MPLPFAYEDLLEQLEPRFVWRGKDYFERRRVEGLNIAQDGHVLTGFVRGSGRRPYKVHVVVRGSPGELEIDGHCTCPVGLDCKHVAALLIAALERQETVTAKPAPGRGDAAAVDDWFRELDQALQPPTPREDYPPNVHQRLLYVLRARDYERASVLDIDFQVVRRLKAGGYGKATGYNPENLFNYGAPQYLMESDQDILRRLRARHILEMTPLNRLTGAGTGELLARMLATGRCHWQDKDRPPLAVGEVRDAQPAWVIDEAGVQRLEIRTSPPATRILSTVPPWYLDLENGQCGPLALELPEPLIEAVLNAPAVPPDRVQVVRKKLKALPVPAPEALKVRNKAVVRPQPVLNLCTQVVRLGGSYWSPGEEIRLPVARLTLDYGGHEIDPADPRPELRWLEKSVVLRQPRDRHTEGESLARLESLGLEPLQTVLPPIDGIPANAFVWDGEAEDEPDAWVDFLLETAPALRADGWRIETAEDFPFSMAEVQEWTLDLDDNPDQHWFDLDLGIIVDGQRLSLLPILLDAVRQFPGELSPAALAQLPEGHRMLVPLEDGRILPLPSERVAAILGVLVELFDPDSLNAEGRLHLPEWRAAELAELDAGTEQAARMRWLGGERLQSLGERLRGFEGIQPVAVPEGFGTELRPYQQDGLNWLQFLRDYGLNGVLADDMGLGKTVEALAHLMAERAAGRLDRPSLVVAPTSLMYNWRHEAQRFAPELRVLTLHGPDRKQHFASIAEHDLVLTTYPLLSRDEAILAAQPFHLVILDEAQFIKNPKAKATRVAHTLDARHRLCLSGTPLENHLGELWSIFHFLMPGLLGDERQFRRLFRTPIEKQGDGERGARLARRVAPFLLRRTKEEVAGDLPPKTEIVRSVPLEGAQRDLYESIRLAMHDKVRRAIDQKGAARSQIVILDALLKLRQVCCDPRLLKMAAAKKARHSAKLEMLMELLPELLEEGRRILLFSQFTSMLALIEAELEARRIDYVKLTGRTRDRATPIRRFQNGEVPLFLISLKAGGTGLNLTAADTVIHYDPWWNPAVEAQATDRAHRIGQDKPVFVYKLLTEGTVEERIQALQAHKRQLANSLFEGAGKGKLPGADDLDELFRPL